jgi:peptidoglycan/LPS O-acetylase OafA/YrhL
MGKARSVLFSVVMALLGMSLAAAAILSIAGSQILPLDQVFLGANGPMAVLTLGIGFLVAAAERGMQNTFTRLAIIYAVASVIYQFTAGPGLGNHTFMQAVIVPVVGAVLLILLHPDPRAIVPTTGSTMRTAGTTTP